MKRDMHNIEVDCPHCGSKRYDRFDIEWECDYGFVDCRCAKCKKNFTEIVKVVMQSWQ